MKKLTFYIAFIALLWGTDGIVPAVFASSVTIPTETIQNADYGVPFYQDSLTADTGYSFSGAGGSMDLVDLGSQPYTILSIDAITNSGSGATFDNNAICESALPRDMGQYTYGLVGASVFTYHIATPIHCIGAFNVQSGDSAFISVQYVPYDTRLNSAPTGASSSPIYIQDAGNLSFLGSIFLVFSFLGFLGYIWNRAHRKRKY